MEIHPAASIFPTMSAEEFAALKADIQVNGLREPIWLHDDQIIDGRNRYNACEAVSVEPKFREWDGKGSLTSFVISLNLIRRHLDDTQRGMAAARAKPMFEEEARARQATSTGGSNPQLRANLREADNGKSSEKAAEEFNVSPRTVEYAAKVIEEAQPEIIELCETGKMAASTAASIADAPPEFQQKVAEAIKNGEAKSGKDAIRLARKAEIEAEATLPSGKYLILYADPPWKYGDQLTENYGGTRYQYPSMTIAELCAFQLGVMPVADLAEENAVLFMWVTSPLLEECFPIIKAWGFKYKASFVWDKVKHNMGHYNSVRHEFLLVCTRGSCTPDVSKLYDSVQSIERTEKHSEKPEEFRQIIDTIYPHGSRLELFARKQVEGWEVHGNQL